jgi:hypothetical protein
MRARGSRLEVEARGRAPYFNTLGLRHIPQHEVSEKEKGGPQAALRNCEFDPAINRFAKKIDTPAKPA